MDVCDVSEVSDIKARLNEDGYVLLKKIAMVPDRVQKYFFKLAENNARVIFNHNEKSNTDDRKRTQKKINRKSKYVDNFMKTVDNQLVTMFPNLKINDWVLIKSYPGCKDQAAHTDYPPSDDMTDESNIPVNAMVAIQDSTFVRVWPKSHRLICNDLYDDKGKNTWDEMSIQEYESFQKIRPYKIQFDRGDMLIFRGDLVHAGSSYADSNVRMHCFLDNNENRIPNKTWLIHKNCSKHIRDIIDC